MRRKILKLDEDLLISGGDLNVVLPLSFSSCGAVNFVNKGDDCSVNCALKLSMKSTELING